MKFRMVSLLILLFICASARANDTLYFLLSNPWNTVKSSTGKYLRKCVQEGGYYHCWDYNRRNILVTESFYADTIFTKKLLCHKYFDENDGLLEQTRCYKDGRLHGYFVNYSKKGDTTSYQVYESGSVIKEWSPTEEKNDQVFQAVETAAEFPGGRQAWIAYLGNNLDYPKALKRNNISGEIIAKVYIDSNGNVRNVEIVESLHPLLDKEVIRVIYASPKWKPATQNGKAVKMTFNQPISF